MYALSLFLKQFIPPNFVPDMSCPLLWLPVSENMKKLGSVLIPVPILTLRAFSSDVSCLCSCFLNSFLQPGPFSRETWVLLPLWGSWHKHSPPPPSSSSGKNGGNTLSTPDGGRIPTFLAKLLPPRRHWVHTSRYRYILRANASYVSAYSSLPYSLVFPLPSRCMVWWPQWWWPYTNKVFISDTWMTGSCWHPHNRKMLTQCVTCCSCMPSCVYRSITSSNWWPPSPLSTWAWLFTRSPYRLSPYLPGLHSPPHQAMDVFAWSYGLSDPPDFRLATAHVSTLSPVEQVPGHLHPDGVACFHPVQPPLLSERGTPGIYYT